MVNALHLVSDIAPGERNKEQTQGNEQHAPDYRRPFAQGQAAAHDVSGHVGQGHGQGGEIIDLAADDEDDQAAVYAELILASVCDSYEKTAAPLTLSLDLKADI